MAALRELHRYARSRGATVRDWDDFEGSFSSEEYRKKFFNVLVEKDLYDRDWEDFEKKYADSWKESLKEEYDFRKNKTTYAEFKSLKSKYDRPGLDLEGTYINWKNLWSNVGFYEDWEEKELKELGGTYQDYVDWIEESNPEKFEESQISEDSTDEWIKGRIRDGTFRDENNNFVEKRNANDEYVQELKGTDYYEHLQLEYDFRKNRSLNDALKGDTDGIKEYYGIRPADDFVEKYLKGELELTESQKGDERYVNLIADIEKLKNKPDIQDNINKLEVLLSEAKKIDDWEKVEQYTNEISRLAADGGTPSEDSGIPTIQDVIESMSEEGLLSKVMKKDFSEKWDNEYYTDKEINRYIRRQSYDYMPGFDIDNIDKIFSDQMGDSFDEDQFKDWFKTDKWVRGQAEQRFTTHYDATTGKFYTKHRITSDVQRAFGGEESIVLAESYAEDWQIDVINRYRQHRNNEMSSEIEFYNRRHIPEQLRHIADVQKEMDKLKPFVDELETLYKGFEDGSIKKTKENIALYEIYSKHGERFNKLIGEQDKILTDQTLDQIEGYVELIDEVEDYKSMELRLFNTEGYGKELKARIDEQIEEDEWYANTTGAWVWETMETVYNIGVNFVEGIADLSISLKNITGQISDNDAFLLSDRLHNTMDNYVKATVYSKPLTDPETGEWNMDRLWVSSVRTIGDMAVMVLGGGKFKLGLTAIAKGLLRKGGIETVKKSPKLLKYGTMGIDAFSAAAASVPIILPQNMREAIENVSEDFSVEEALNYAYLSTMVEASIEAFNPDFKFVRPNIGAVIRTAKRENISIIKALKNSTLRGLGESLQGVSKEIFEEFLQNFMSGAINQGYNNTFGTGFHVPTGEEYAETALLTAIATLTMRGFSGNLFNPDNSGLLLAASRNPKLFMDELDKQYDNKDITEKQYEKIKKQLDMFLMIKEELGDDVWENEDGSPKMTKQRMGDYVNLIIKRNHIQALMKKNPELADDLQKELDKANKDITNLSNTIEVENSVYEVIKKDREIKKTERKLKDGRLGKKRKAELNKELNKLKKDKKDLMALTPEYAINGKAYKTRKEFLKALRAYKQSGKLKRGAHLDITVKNDPDAETEGYKVLGEKYAPKGKFRKNAGRVVMNKKQAAETEQWIDNRTQEEVQEELDEELSKRSKKQDKGKIRDLRNALKYFYLKQEGYEFGTKGFLVKDVDVNTTMNDFMLKQNIEFLSKYGKKIGGKVVGEKWTEEQYNAEMRRLGFDKQGAIGENGFFDHTTKTFYVNKDVAKKHGALSVGSHELLHGILHARLNDSKGRLTKEGEALINDFIDLLKRKNPKAFKMVQAQIDGRYRYNPDRSEKDFKEYAEEYLNVFHELVDKNLIEFNESLWAKIGELLRTFFRKIGIRAELGNGRDVYDFLKNYSKDVKSGDLRKSTIAMGKKSLRSIEEIRTEEQVTSDPSSEKFEKDIDENLEKEIKQEEDAELLSELNIDPKKKKVTKKEKKVTKKKQKDIDKETEELDKQGEKILSEQDILSDKITEKRKESKDTSRFNLFKRKEINREIEDLQAQWQDLSIEIEAIYDKRVELTGEEPPFLKFSKAQFTPDQREDLFTSTNKQVNDALGMFGIKDFDTMDEEAQAETWGKLTDDNKLLVGYMLGPSWRGWIATRADLKYGNMGSLWADKREEFLDRITQGIEKEDNGLPFLVKTWSPLKSKLTTHIFGNLELRMPHTARSIDGFGEVIPSDYLKDEVDEVLEKEKESLRVLLGLEEGGKIYNKTIEAVIKTFGTKLPDIDSKEFKAELKKRYAVELKKTISDLMSTGERYKLFLRENFEAIFDNVEIETWVQIERLVKDPSKRIFTTVEIESMTRKQTKEAIKQNRVSKTTNLDAGNTLWKFKKPNVDQFVDYYTDKSIGISTRGDRKIRLAEILAGEMGFDATMETLKDPKLKKKVRAIREISGQEAVENDIEVIAKQIGRNPNLKFSKTNDTQIKFSISSQEFFDQAMDLSKQALVHGLDSEQYELGEIAVDHTVADFMRDIFELNPDLSEGPKGFISILKNKSVLSKAFRKRIKNNELRLYEGKEVAEAMDEFVKNTVKLGLILDAAFLENLDPNLAILNFHNRGADPAEKKRSTGEPGFAREEYETIKESEYTEDLKFAPEDIRPMNKDAKWFDDKINKIFAETNLIKKFKLLEEVREEIELANAANIDALVYFENKLNQALKTDGIINVDYIYQLHQAQTNLAFGIRALSRMDFIYLEEGNQLLPPKLSYSDWINKKGNENKTQQEFLDSKEFKVYRKKLSNTNHFNNIYKQQYKILTQTGVKINKKLVKFKGTEAEIKAIDRAYKKVTIKGEHMGPNANTMSDIVTMHLTNNFSEKSLRETIKDHTQFFGPTFIMDAMDEIGKTSREGLFRMLKSPTFKANYLKNTYHISGMKADVWLTEKATFDKITLKFSKSSDINTAQTVDNAIKFSRTVNDPKGISVWDFDDTIAKTKSKVLFTTPDGTKGTLNAEEYASQYVDLAAQGYKFDFSEFDIVVKGEKGPFFEKFVNRIKKFGVKDNFILTARPIESAPAIKEFLKSQGLNIPLGNITGLANSTSEAKAIWIAEKVGEGYNDFYFADDALANVQAVKNMLDQFDVKSDVQQAKLKFSKTMNEEFNKILEETMGVDAAKKFSEAQAKLGAARDRWKYIVPPSAQDFKGLIYNFLPKGKRGEEAMEFFQEALFDPFARSYDEINSTKQLSKNSYNELLKDFPDIKDILNEKVAGTDFTNEHAVRVYLWTKAGFRIPFLSRNDQRQLYRAVENNSELKTFATSIGLISKKMDGYTKPGNHWLVENVKSDLFNDSSFGDTRAEILAEWIQNKNIIFSKENLNKIEALYGSNFREALEDILYRMETGSNRPTGKNRLVNKYLNWVNNSVGAIMFFNMRSAVLQTISTVNYINWSDNNILKAAAAFANQKQFWSDFVYIFNSDMLKQRRGGLKYNVNEAELAEAVKDSKNKAKAAIAWLLKKGFLPTQIADSFAISMGGATFYRNRIKSLMEADPNITLQEAEKQAWIDFQETTEEAQQSSRPDLISQQQANPLGRLILAFANTPMQYARIMNKAIRDLVAGRGDTKTHISKIVYYGAIQSFIFNALQSMIFASDDEEELDKKQYRVVNGMFDGWMLGLGYTGRAISTIKNTLVEYNKQKEKGFTSDHTYTILQAVNFSPPIGSKLRKLYSAIQTEKFNRDVMSERGFTLDNPIWSATGNVIEAFTNIPLGRLSNKMLNLDNAFDSNNDIWQRAALLMGWNTWDLGIKDPDIEGLRGEIKERKKIEKKEIKRIEKETKYKEIEQRFEDDQNKERKQNKKDIKCSSVVNGNRCKNKVIGNGNKCTIHENVEQKTSGKKTQCKFMKKINKKKKERCKMQTANKSGLCYYHD